MPFLGNEPVVIKSKPTLSAIVGKLYKYDLAVEDDGKTKLVFNLFESPEGMTIEGSTGLLLWTPTQEQVGEHNVKIRVSDGWYKDEQEFTILVKLFQLESIVVEPAKMTFESLNKIENIKSIKANYTDGSVNEITDRAKCVFQSKDNSVATVDEEGRVTSRTYASTTVTVSYTEDGVTKTANISVNIKRPVTIGGG